MRKGSMIAAVVVCLAICQTSSAQIFRPRLRSANPAPVPTQPALPDESSINRDSTTTPATPSEVHAGTAAPGALQGRPCCDKATTTSAPIQPTALRDGTQPPQPMPATQTKAPDSGAPVRLPPCDGGGTPPNVTCEIRIIKQINCPAGPKMCTPIPFDSTLVGKLIEIDGGTLPFYKAKSFAKGDVSIPVQKKTTVETIEFGTVTITLPCCEVEICIPCKFCKQDVFVCDTKKELIDIEVAVRQDGTIDVYALNVKGMPKRYVAFLAMSPDAFKKAFPNVPIP